MHVKNWPAAATLALALALAACTAAPAAPPAPAATPSPAPTALPTPTAAPWNGVCDLYSQVLEDLWAVDPGLNGGLRVLGLDLSEAPGGLTPAEKTALAEKFGATHGLEVVEATWQELADAGEIDAEALYWEDGLLFAIRADKGADDDGALHFTAEKWRGGLGAYLFSGRTAQKNDGVWQYTVGAEAIA